MKTNVTAGNLSTQLETEININTLLTLTGEINADDIATIRSIANLSVLNLADVNIVEGGSFYNDDQEYITTRNNEIPEYMFAGMEIITSITLPNTATVIGKRAFSGCIELTSVTIPDSILNIGVYAFEGCNGLTSVEIPSGAIGNYAFFRLRRNNFIKFG